MNLLEVSKKFPNQQACVEYLEQKRWNGKPTCPYCGSENTNKTYNQDKERFRHFCNGCVKSFSVTVGTIFEDSRLSLDKWFMAIALILNAKKGISSHQIARDVGIRQATAWSIAQRVRKAMQQDKGLLSGIVEMDELTLAANLVKKRRKRSK